MIDSGASSVAAMLVVLLVSPFLVFVVHMAWARIASTVSRQVAAIQAVGLASVPTAALLWYFALRTLPTFAEVITASSYCLIVYVSLSITYFHFFNMSETARRIRILYEIYRAGSLPAERLEAIYRVTGVVHVRLQRLLDMGQLKEEEGYYSIKGRTLYWASVVIMLWRRLLRL